MAYVGRQSKNSARPVCPNHGWYKWGWDGRIQIAKLYNCDVIATAGNKEKMDKCLEIGADYVVNHRDADWYKTVRSITKNSMRGEGVDIIFEHIGRSVFAKAVSLLKMGGELW